MKTPSLAAWLLLALELAVVLVSTLGVVSVTYESRTLFSALETTRNQQRNELEQWGKLLLEESAFSAPSRVERIAREELNMILPEVGDVVQKP